MITIHTSLSQKLQNSQRKMTKSATLNHPSLITKAEPRAQSYTNTAELFLISIHHFSHNLIIFNLVIHLLQSFSLIRPGIHYICQNACKQSEKTVNREDDEPSRTMLSTAG